MMTLKLQIVIAIAILAILAVLVNMIRKRSLELKYALVWMMVLAEMFRERMVANSRVNPGRGMAAAIRKADEWHENSLYGFRQCG